MRSFTPVSGSTRHRRIQRSEIFVIRSEDTPVPFKGLVHTVQALLRRRHFQTLSSLSRPLSSTHSLQMTSYGLVSEASALSAIKYVPFGAQWRGPPPKNAPP